MKKTNYLNSDQIKFLTKFLLNVSDDVILRFIGTPYMSLGMNKFIRSRISDTVYNPLERGYHQVAFNEIREYWIKNHTKNKK